MSEFPCLTAVEIVAEIGAAPWIDEEQIVHEITGTIIGMISENEEVEFGTIKLLKISATHACNQQLDLLEACDAHSVFLESVYHAIFDSKGDTKDDLEIEPGWNDILVLWEFTVAEAYRKTAIVTQAFETAISFLGSQDLIVAAMDGERFIGLELTIEEWRELGFVKIAGTQFVFRDQCMVNPYKRNPNLDLLDDPEDGSEL